LSLQKFTYVSIGAWNFIFSCTNLSYDVKLNSKTAISCCAYFFLFVLLERLDKIQLIIRYLSFGSQTGSFIKLMLLEFTKQNQRRDYEYENDNLPVDNVLDLMLAIVMEYIKKHINPLTNLSIKSCPLCADTVINTE